MPDAEELPLTGHNVGNVAADRLRSLVERIERLNEEKKGLNDDIKDIFLEGKNAGYDVKVMRRLIQERGRDPGEVQEEQALLDVYRDALAGRSAAIPAPKVQQADPKPRGGRQKAAEAAA